MVPLGKKTCEGTRIDGIITQFGLEQMIDNPTNILGGRPSCIDLIFASQPNLVLNLFASKLSSSNSVSTVQSQSSLPTSIWAWIWQFQKANVEHIKISINGVQWMLMTLSIYLRELWKIYNFILDEIIACDDRDRTSIDNSKRRLLQDKNEGNRPLESSNNNSQHF